MQSQEQFPSYQDITYENLGPLPDTTDFASMPSMLLPILTSNQWEQQLQALTFLRQLNKQYPTQVFNILQTFYTGLNQTLAGSPKVSKYAIQTLTELLQNAQQCQSIGFGFAKVMETLLSKTLSEQKSVALLAQNLLSQIIQNQYSDSYDNYAMALIDLIYTNKNVSLAENAVKAIAHLIASKGLAGLQSLQMDNLGKLVQFIAKLTVAKRKTFQNYAGQIANYLLELSGEQVLSNLMTNFLLEEDQQNMIKAINTVKAKGTQNSGTQLSMQLRQHIRQVKQSHIVSNNMKEIFGDQYQAQYQPLQSINPANLLNMQNNYNQQQFQVQKQNNLNYSFGGNNENNIFYANQQAECQMQQNTIEKPFQIQQNIQQSVQMNQQFMN